MINFKKAVALFLSCSMFLTSCSSSKKERVETDSVSETVSTTISKSTSDDISDTIVSVDIDIHSEDYINSLGFTSLDDDDFKRYLEDTVYADLVNQLDSEEYLVENVEAIYISKEYIDELEYNSKENVYFGYKLSELDEAFQGEKYIFTLSKSGETEVVPFEEYDDTYDQVIRNVAIGTGVILLCVTVSVVSAGAGAPAVSLVFAASAKGATTFALSSGVISGVSAGVVEGMETHDFDKAVKAAALEGSEAYMWGAITGALTGGAGEAIALKGATLNGLTMNEAAMIQKESKYPLDVIKQFSSMEQYEICKEAGLTAEMVNGKTALIRNIDLDYIAEEANGKTNLELMRKGYAPFDSSGVKYDLHHIGQKNDSTLAILTKSEHMQNGNNKIWHELVVESEIDREAFKEIREAFWIDMASKLAG